MFTHTQTHTHIHTYKHTFFLLENRIQQPNSIAASPLKSASDDDRQAMKKVGDVRQFKFDQKNEECNLRDRKGFLVKKETAGAIGHSYYYRAYIGNWKIGYALCGESALGSVNTLVQARQCGVGTVVSYFCIIDPYVNDPKRKAPNSNAKTYVDIEDEFKHSNNENVGLIAEAKNCANLLTLDMVSKVNNAANTYFNAAKVAKFKKVFFINKEKNRKGTSLSLEEAQKEYNENCKAFINKYGKSWYFCKE